MGFCQILLLLDANDEYFLRKVKEFFKKRLQKEKIRDTIEKQKILGGTNHGIQD